MKKIFTHLFALFLLSLVTTSNVWAQETTEITVTPSEGSYSGTGWSSSWTSSSSSEYLVTISVGGINNLNAANTSGGFQMARGSNADSDWTFSVEGYKVVSYSFKFKSAIENQNVTLSATNADGTAVSMTSSYSEEKTFSIDCSNASTATFRISGENYSIIATDLTLTVREPLALTSLEVGQVYRFINVLYPTYSLNANSATDVNSVTTSETDTRQQWYVAAKDGEYYVLRNLAYGKFLKGNGQSSAWSMSDDYSHDYNKFKLYSSNVDYNTLHTNTLANYAYIHCNSSYNIVGWSNGTTDRGSHWAIKEVDYTEEQITALLEKAPTVAESAAYVTSLEALFTDDACVTPALASLSEAQATDAYKALPATLKAMVDKVYNEKTGGVAIKTAWTENNADADKVSAGLNWDGDYAKKFRVQMYEPYSIAGDITGFLRMNAHANNDNPTGIYVPGGGTVYIMVEGNIKGGATLRLINAGSNGRITDATTGGYELNTGLNVINFAAETGMLYICYNVDTYDPDGASEELKFPHKLSEYPPLKIHIEGGSINGFYSSCGDYLAGRSFGDDLSAENNLDLWGGVDDDNDWIYMEERANLSVLPIISHRQVLLFQLNEENGQQGMKHFLPESVSVPEIPFSYPQNGETASWDDYDAYGMDCNITTGRINIWMETWDRIMHAELATLGLISEDNVNIMNKFYPRWTSDGSKAEIYDMTNAGPDGNTYKVFCNGRDYSEYYNHHGVSLGTTSGYMSAGWNAANYNNSTFGELMGMPTSGGLWGPVHEIGHQFQDVFNIRGATEVTNNVFSNAATWYQGISTSRYNGGNLTTTLDNFNSGLPFVDYNIWSMTQMFYKLWLYYHLAGNNTQFYPRFFELLRVDPLNAKGATATGTESMLKIYEKICDAAGEDLTEFFRAHGFFVLLDNYAKGDYGTTIFTQTQEEVDAAIARVKAKYTKENFAVILINDGAEATLRHDGKTPRSFFDGTAHPEYGGVNDFIDGSATTGGTYEAVVNNDGTVTMKGEGGIGFLVFDENGNIISFSDNPTFALSDEAKESIMTGNVTVVSIGSDINAEPVVAKIDLTAMQKNILGELIAKAQKIIDKIDDTYTRIGFYRGAAVADLATVLANARTVYEGASGYEAAYDLLYAEYQKVLENPNAKIPFDPSLTYIITNKAYTNETMWVNNELTVRSEGGVDQTADAAKWQFKATATDGVYNIYNMKGYYCPAVAQSTAMTATATAAADALYTLQEMETGVWAIKLSPAAGYRNFHSSWSNVVGWETGSDATRWYLTAVKPNATIAGLTELEVYINKTEALLGEVLGTVTYTRGENIALQTTTEGNPYYVWTNAQEAGEGPIANLVDGAANNYFHTDWHAENISSGDHYIAVDLGADNTLSRFAFSHTTRAGNNITSDFPKSVDVYGSDEKNGIYKYLGSATGMPQTQGAFWQFEGVMISSHRYLRFNMHADRGYWHMAEFDIMPVTGYTPTVNDAYSGIVTVATVQSAMEAMYNGKGVVVSTSPAEGDIDAKLEALRSAYNALYTEYSAAITARKNTLAQLAAQTQNLIKEAGTVEIIPTIEAKLQTTNPNGDFYVSTNAQSSQEGPIANLVDGDNTTYFHTDYSGNNSTDELDHCINIKLGEANATKSFEFSYVTRHNAETNYPTAMEIYGSADGTTYEKIAEITEGMPVSNTATYNSELIECDKEYTYLRFMVTANSSGTDKGGHPFFHMAEFDLTTIGSTTVTVNSTYNKVLSKDLLLSSYLATQSSAAMSTNALVTSVPLLDAQIADQQAAYDRLNEAMQKATCDKTALQAAYDEALELYNKMADAEGNVTTNYAPSTLTVEQLAAAKTALDAAKDKLDNSNDQDEIDTAKGNLDTAFAPLNTVESLNVAATKDKSALETLIDNANTLLGTINGNIESNENYYAGANGLALAELQAARDAAVDAKDRYYLTEEQYTNVYNTLNSCYTTTNTVVIADVAKDELNTLITTMEGLLATTTVSGAQTAGSLPLQVTDKTESFYILTYPRATDDNGKGAIIDETDGVGNTGTFTGTYWQSSSEAYSHYVEIDLGVNTVIEDFTIDYTTRLSGAADSRPTGLKFYGSNDKETYTELFAVTEGLPTAENTKWEMSAPYELAKNYRYIRVAVASTRGGCFNMSDFNIYSHCTATVNQNYSTSDIFDCLPAALREYCDAKEAVGKYLIAADCTAAKEQLQAQIDAIQGVIDSNLNERAVLETLANETNALVTKVATINEAETAITMQCTDENAPYYLYCNAAGAGNGGSDALGVAALVGDKATNTEHLHTAYQGSTDDDLDHYLRLDMGENKAMMSFKFSYTGRNDGNNNDPKVMLIEGSNDRENFELITKLTDLPSSSTPTTYTSDVLGNGKAYRYIRFMVIKTNNNSMYKEHPFFVLSQFAVTACKTIEVNSEYVSPKLPLTTLVTASNEVAEAGIVVNQFYVTQDAYDNAYAELEAANEALKIAATADKSELEALIEATTLLKNRMYEIESYTANEITLQNDTEGAAGYLYCNAAGSTNNYSGDNLGVDALLDNDTNTSNFLHTTYYGNDNKDGLDHYLRVDLGESKEYIRFRYKGRSGHAALTPKNAVVQATNDLSGEWTNIATLYGLTQTTDEVSTACLGNGVAYRYWRFMVTATYDGREQDGHPYYALSAFNVDVCTDVVISSQLKSEYNPEIYIYTTSTLVTEVENAITEAETVVDNEGASQTDVNSEVEALQAVYDKLEEALKYAGVPVVITTDEENPVLYKIISKRADDDSKVLQFDEPATDKVAIVATANNASYQAWYFMQGEYGYLIKPFNGCGKVLSVESTGDGSAKAYIAEESENIYSEWNFSRSAVEGCTDYFYIYVNGTSHACLSHNGGFNETDKLGIWSSGWNTNDGGSLFKFVEAEFENENARYYQLSDFENTLEYQTAVTPEGTTVGAFTNGDAYSTAYTTASTLIEAGNTSATADCYNAYTALRTASEDVERIEPEEGKIYRIYITPGLTDNRAGASMRIGDNGKLACGEYAAANTEYYFAFEYDDAGNLYMKNFHSGTYLDEALTYPSNENVPVGADAETIDAAKKIAINTLGKSGDAVVVGIVPDGGDMLNCAGKTGNVVAYDNTAVDKASAWVIEEVTDETVAENIKQSVTLNDSNDGNKYSTLYLGYNATIPENVTASIVTGLNELGQLIMRDVTELTGGEPILPAKTAVVLSGTVDGAEFKYAETDDEFDTSENVLKGTAYNKLVNCGETYNIYMLGRKNGRVAFYWAYENRDADGDYVYIDANENVVEENVEGAHKNHNKGGYVKCNANKAYLQMSEDTQGQAAAAMFSFYFGDGTSDIESINAVADTYDNVYDLQGRKLEKVTSPGMYIVGGKKVYVTGVE